MVHVMLLKTEAKVNTGISFYAFLLNGNKILYVCVNLNEKSIINQHECRSKMAYAV